MADVDAFDPQRRVGQPERFLNVLQRSGSGGEVTGPLELVLLQRLLGVAVHGLGQGLLVAAPRHPQRHPRPAQPGQPTGQLIGVGRQARHQHLARHRVGGFVCGLVGFGVQFGLVAVELGEELLDELRLRGIAGVAGLLDDPAALSAHPAAAHVEHLHRGLEVVVGERDHVGVGAVAEHHGLFLERSFERAEVVAQPSGPLEVEFTGRRGHPLFEFTREPVGLAGQEVAEVEHDPPMLLGADPPDARRRAFVDVAEQAWTLDLAVPLEHSGRAGPGGEHPGQQVEGLPDGPGVRVRAEVTDALAARTAVDHQPRELLVECDRQNRVGLVVAVADVEPRIELLDPVVFQLQGLDLGVDHGPLDLGRCRDHLPGPRVQAADVGEVGRQPAAQALGLADVDDPSVRIPEPIDARLDGNRPGRRSVRRRIGHALQVSTAARRAGPAGRARRRRGAPLRVG